MTATPARIRLCVREAEYATASDAAVLAARPDANDGYEAVIESFFDTVGDAQVMLNERFAFLKAVRTHEAAEADTPLTPGYGIAVAPVVPKARMVDQSRGIDVTIPIRGLAVDMEGDRNSIEADG